MKLELNDVAFSYKDKTFRYNLTAKEGISAVFGESGAGKSTLLNIISGALRPSRGRITFDGNTLFDKSKGIDVPPHERGIGIVFQNNLLFPHMSTEENLKFSKRYRKGFGVDVSFQSAVELLDLQGLLKKRPGELSGGEQQRVAIGRALLSKPRMLLLDEPFSNLDKSRRSLIISYLLKINQRFKLPLIIISHDLEDVLKLTDSLIVIEDGEVCANAGFYESAAAEIGGLSLNGSSFINAFDAVHEEEGEDGLHIFRATSSGGYLRLKTGLGRKGMSAVNKKVRLCVLPDEIALSLNPCPASSIQNQFEVPVKCAVEKGGGVYVTLDIANGVIAEISKTAARKLDVYKREKLYCLIKAKALDLLHVFD